MQRISISGISRIPPRRFVWIGVGLIIVASIVGGVVSTGKRLSTERVSAELLSVIRPPTAFLTLDLTDLPPTSDRMHYLVWLQDEKGLWNTGPTFTRSVTGALLNTNGFPTTSFPIERDPAKITGIRITIESTQIEPVSSSERIILEGEVQDGSFNLASPIEELDVIGTSVLATPSNGLDLATQETSGIWFATLKDGAFSTPGLTLPPPPLGFTYDATISTLGRIFHTSTFDETRTRTHNRDHADTGELFPVPGIDLLRNPPPGLVFPLDLTQGDVRISVNLVPKNDENMFFTREPFLPLIEQDLPKGIAAHTAIPFTRAIHFPYGAGHIE